MYHNSFTLPIKLTCLSECSITHVTVQQFEQRRLAGSVGPDERQPRVQVDTELQVLVDPRTRVVVSERYVL